MTYLEDHLSEVVESIVGLGDIAIAAMGVGYAPYEFYPVADYVEPPSELGIAKISLLERLLLD